jgi:cytochrome c biogenesis protein CcdA/thiol-disulfide isomerase/thioredoxin
MIEAPFALAFGAGLVATLNPCGFAMLPAYLSYFMGSTQEDNLSRSASLRRALVVGGVMSAAFLLVFGVTGLAITLGFRAVIDWIPWIALAVGGLVVILGVAMLFGYELTVGLPKAKQANTGKGLRSVFAFGVSYGLASLSCTLPVFLSVVATQLTASSLVSGVSTFIVYGLGMSMMLIGVTLVMALGKQTIVHRLRSSARYINRISGAVLVLAGGYIVWFWGTTLASGAGALNNSGAFRFFETLSQRATETFGQNALFWGLALGSLIAATAAYAFLKDRIAGGGSDEDPNEGGRSTKSRRGLVKGTAVAAILAVVVGVFVLATGSSDDGSMAMASEDEAQAAPGTNAAPAGEPAPTDTFLFFDGTEATFADYRGTALVVNFWASWCPSCVAELSAAIRPAQDRFGDEVGFIGVNLQDDRASAVELIEETGVQFDLAEDADGTLYTRFGAIGMPFTAFIAADGSIVDTHNGPLTEGQLADKITEFLLGDSAETPADPEPTAADLDTPVPAADPDVIVETDPVLPGVLAQLQGWATNWGRRTIDLDELIAGIRASDPRDVIPPLDSPEYESVAVAAEWLEGREPGVLVEIGDDVRFFPLRIMTFHEIVNDTIGGRPVVVTFCPLCNTAVVFDPTVGGDTLRFGVSGLLRFSDLVMWDSTTETLWQQITGEAIVGDLAGTQLELLPSAVIGWDEFRTSFPDGRVLSRQTGFERSYGINPYVGYSSSSSPFLFDGDIDDRFPALERVVGVTVGDSDKAFPFSVISGPRVVNDTVGDLPVAIFWGSDTADALDTANIAEGRAVGTGIAFDRRVGNEVLTFTANGDDTFTDTETGSTWDLLGRATEGPLAGEELDTVVHRNDFWFAWAAFNVGDPVYGA